MCRQCETKIARSVDAVVVMAAVAVGITVVDVVIVRRRRNQISFHSEFIDFLHLNP